MDWGDLTYISAATESRRTRKAAGRSHKGTTVKHSNDHVFGSKIQSNRMPRHDDPVSKDDDLVSKYAVVLDLASKH